MSDFDLNFGSMDSTASPDITKTLADYFNNNFGQKTSGLMPTDTSKGFQSPDLIGGGPDTMVKGKGDNDIWKVLGLFNNGGSPAHNPNDDAWYNQGIYHNSSGGSGMGSVLKLVDMFL